MTMRKLLSIAVVLTAVLSFAALSAAAEVVVTYGRTSVEPGDPLDCHFGGGAASYQNYPLIYEGLVGYNNITNRIEGLLASSWEASEDSRVWTFHVRQGIKFHDGTDLNAEAVRFNFERMITGVINDMAQVNYADPTIEVLDEYTIRLSFPEPFATLPTELTYNTYGVMSPTFIKTNATPSDPWAVQALRSRAVGTGPFVLVEYRPNESMTFQKFAGYWGGVPGMRTSPKYDKLIMRIIPDATTRALMLETGELDIAEGIPTDLRNKLAKNPNLKVEYYPQANACSYLMMNGTKAPFDNFKVRQAIAYAIDYNAILQDLEGGHQQPMHGGMPQGMLGADPNGVTFHRDLALAKTLMAEAGYAKGFKTSLAFSDQRWAGFPAIAEVVQANLAEIGIDLELQAMTFTAQKDLRTNNTHLLDLYTVSFGTGDPSSWARSVRHPSDPIFDPYYEYWWATNPNVALTTDLEEQGLVVADPDKRAAIYRQLDQLAMADFAVVPLFQISTPYVMRSNIYGYVFDHWCRGRLWQIEKRG
ncbi:MAG: ABC transporter substrate-binding protein [Candidatus Bipolaricaulota bacterium]|nr:ABC transporter substrate-binding protein [Candidatus Bipolaricaulota bacterium]